MVHDLEAAAGRARSLGCPVPLDTVTGFETGCHLSGESNVVLLIGWKTVHPIALPSVDEMFNWAEVLERALIGECAGDGVCVCTRVCDWLAACQMCVCVSMAACARFAAMPMAVVLPIAILALVRVWVRNLAFDEGRA